MARVTETISTVNSLIRTLIALAICGTAGYGGWMGYTLYQNHVGDQEARDRQLADARLKLSEKDRLLANRDATIHELTETVTEQDASLQEQQIKLSELEKRLTESNEKVEQLEVALNFLKVDHRLAQITVLDQVRDEETDEIVSFIEFVEINDEGSPIDTPRKFEIQGDLVYVDYWLVKFDDKYVESAAVDRSTSICLFRRIFGEFQQPNDGYVLDEVGSRPTAYARGGKMSEFEKSIWNDFWNIASDPQAAREMGIRAAHGDAVYTRLRKGQKYRLHLRASGGLSITPIQQASVIQQRSTF